MINRRSIAMLTAIMVPSFRLAIARALHVDVSLVKKIHVLLFMVVMAMTISCSREDNQKAVPVVDTHIHLYDVDRLPGLPWPEKDNKTLYRSVLANDYNTVMDKNNLSGVIVVEASPRVSDNDWVLHHTSKFKDKYLGLIGALEFDKKTFKDDFARLCENERFLGLRIGTQYLDQPANPDYLKNQIVLDNLQLLSDSGKSLDVLIFKQSLEDVVFLAQKYPRLKIVINSIGAPTIDGKEPALEWKNKMQAAAALPNVYLKICSQVQHCVARPVTKDVNYYKPVLEKVFELFGEDRIIYGSNWPCTIDNGEYSEHFQIIRDFFTSKGRRVLEKLCYQNAEKVYGFRLK
jgi:L-fuconolactonase